LRVKKNTTKLGNKLSWYPDNMTYFFTVLFEWIIYIHASRSVFIASHLHIWFTFFVIYLLVVDHRSK